MADRSVSVDGARRHIAAAARPLAVAELPLADALGGVLAEDISSEVDVPPFDSSAMDGYAVPAGAEGPLRVIDEARAGHPARHGLAGGQAIAIATGAPLPAGAGAVIEVERTESSDRTVTVPAVAAGRNIRRAGEVIRSGERVLGAGSALGPAELAVIASLGRARVVCGSAPRLALVVTGDELVPPGGTPEPGQIIDSNRVALAAQARRAGARVVSETHVGDSRSATVAALESALGAGDVVCVSGGVSVGEHDHVRPALAELGVEALFWGVRLKPGKPTWFGRRGEALVFALPGNPVSAMVTFELFVRPALRRLASGPFAHARARARTDSPLPRAPGRTHAVRCRARVAEDGWRVAPTGPQGSHVLTSMLGARALALVEAGEDELPAGAAVDLELLEPGYPGRS